MPKKFAKIFEPEPNRQILVMLGSTDNNEPEVRVIFDPDAPHLISHSHTITWDDNEQGWTEAGMVFDDMDEAEAIKIATQAIEEFHKNRGRKSLSDFLRDIKRECESLSQTCSLAAMRIKDDESLGRTKGVQ